MTDSEIAFRMKIYPEIQRFGYGTKQADWAIKQICGYSRFAMMYQGEVRLFGDYKILNGIYYSNFKMVMKSILQSLKEKVSCWRYHDKRRQP